MATPEFLPTLNDLPALPAFEWAARPDRAQHLSARKWLREQRMWWRYRYVPGAPYPPHADRDAHYSWVADLRAALRNPPDSVYATRRWKR